MKNLFAWKMAGYVGGVIGVTTALFTYIVSVTSHSIGCVEGKNGLNETEE